MRIGSVRLMNIRWITVDGNEAAARVAYHLSEVIAIYPITPSSTMGELSDAWMSEGRTNRWNTVPAVAEMQSEGGAAGALHGALQAGALATSFTASQGLLLMVPNMYKIAGELLPCVLHVTARAIATHALSIFGDHSDVMAVRSTGWGVLAANSVQEAQDLALVAHASTLRSRVPMVHFFDGFRTSHEVAKIASLADEDIAAMVDNADVSAHRARALSPDHPVMRGSAQNPDVFFQGREAANRSYMNCPAIVQDAMDRFGALTGRQYHLFDYEGAPDAERVIIMMGSASETVGETVAWLNARGERVGLVKVRLFRPFSAHHLIKALPATVRHIAVLDRAKEPGAIGEPLYLDIVAALSETFAAGTAPFRLFPRVIGGRYGLGSKEFTPGMAAAVFQELDEKAPRTHFTVGIDDDVTFTSLPWDREFSLASDDTVSAVFYGLGADGTVGANKNSIKIIGDETDLHAQGYFVYDSKKSGSMTVSHLRFGPRPIRSTYLVERAHFVACHQWGLLERVDVLAHAAPGATVLLNSPFPATSAWTALPGNARRHIAEKKLRVFAIDATGRCRRGRRGQTRQHGLAGVLLCTRRRAAARGRDCRDQASGQEELRRQGSGRGHRELRGHRRRDRGHGRSADRRSRREDGGADLRWTGRRDRSLRARRHAPDDCRTRRSAARLGDASRRHLSGGHLEIREAFDRGRDPGVAGQAVHPVQQVHVRLPARGDSGQGVRSRVALHRAGGVQVDGLPRQRIRRDEVQHPGRARRLHGLRLVRAGLPGEGQGDGDQGAADAADRRARRAGARELRMVPRAARTGSHAHETEHRQGLAVPAAPVRVLGCVRRLRRDALLETDNAVVRRSHGGCERDGMLVDLRRQPADDAVDVQSGRPRAGVGELAVRRQRRVRLWHAADDRPAAGARERAREGTRECGWRAAGGCDPHGRST